MSQKIENINDKSLLVIHSHLNIKELPSDDILKCIKENQQAIIVYNLPISLANKIVTSKHFDVYELEKENLKYFSEWYTKEAGYQIERKLKLKSFSKLKLFGIGINLD